MNIYWKKILPLFIGLLLMACQPATNTLPTPANPAPTLDTTSSDPAPIAQIQLPATFTPDPNQLSQPTLAPYQSPTPRPTNTPFSTPLPRPTNTPRSEASPTNPPPSHDGQSLSTETPVPDPTNTPVYSAPPVSGANLLPTGSFEGGHYNHNNIPELQVPNEWRLEWDTGTNALDPASWNDWVRPETRVLSKAFLPSHEHATFIWDGSQTVKIFKEHGAISFRLLTTTHLEPGNYQLQISVYPDLVVDYTTGGDKIFAPDALSGEVRLMADGQDGGWQLPDFGRKNTFTYRFTVTEAKTITIGAAMRGRWAIANNGWFLDDWRLVRVD